MPLAFSTGTSSRPRNALQQRKLKIKTVVLLHLLIPEVLMSSLKAINPWLSACDISHPLQPELQGTCSAISPRQLHKKMMRQGVSSSCPRSCPPNQASILSTSYSPKCLAYLDESRKNAICNFSPTTGKQWLRSFLGQIRLRHCCEHKIIESLSGILLDRVLQGKEDCFQIIDNLVSVDNLAARVSCEFTEVLSRFDCNHSYSVRFSCEDCKEAYRRWVCSSLVPFFNGTVRVRPCRSICQVVEQKCPYFLPENRAPSLPTQYAGEPTFLCVDPNIPESGEQEIRSMYPKEDTCCSKPCGAPYDGICISQGAKCGDHFVYENATKEECNATDLSLIRSPNDKCPGPSVHPGSKISGIPATKSNPFLLVLFTLLTLQVSYPDSRHHLLYSLLVFLILFLLSSSFGIFQLVVCFYFICFPPNINIVEMKASQRFNKMSELIFNYFKLDSRKWQYYFALLPVNLMNGRGSFPGISSPQSPRMRERFNRIRGEKIRRRCTGILSMSAQKMMRGKLFGLTKKEKSVFGRLVVGVSTTDKCCIGIKYNGCTIDRMETCSMMIEKVSLQTLHYRSVMGERMELC